MPLSADNMAYLRRLVEHPILMFSEPPRGFYPLRDEGLVEYREGRWHWTEGGRKLCAEVKAEAKAAEAKPKKLKDFLLKR